MELDALLRHYLATEDPAGADQAAIGRALERIGIDFGVERDPGRRFALWSLMTMLGDAPDPRDAFEDAATRDAAFAFARLLRQAGGDDDPA